MNGDHRPRPLNPEAVRIVARAIKTDRYMSIKVSDEQLVTKVVETYRDLTRRPPRQRRQR
jgi:hypothetical protein